MPGKTFPALLWSADTRDIVQHIVKHFVVAQIPFFRFPPFFFDVERENMPAQKSNAIVDPRDSHFKYSSLINEGENII